MQYVTLTQKLRMLRSIISVRSLTTVKCAKELNIVLRLHFQKLSKAYFVFIPAYERIECSFSGKFVKIRFFVRLGISDKPTLLFLNPPL